MRPLFCGDGFVHERKRVRIEGIVACEERSHCCCCCWSADSDDFEFMVVDLHADHADHAVQPPLV